MSQNAAALKNVKPYAKGSVIVQAGDQNGELFLLLQGSAGVYKNYRMNGEAVVTVLSQGGAFGEMALFLGKAQEHTLVALTDSVILSVSRKNVGEFFASRPDAAFGIVEGICRRSEQLRDMLEKYEIEHSDQAASQVSSLFPEGHGSYKLELNNTNQELLYPQKCTCPLCGHNFESLTVISTKLRMERTDSDLRTRYKDIEPIYYDIITCPNCFLSATNDQFADISKRWMEDINQKVGPYKLELEIKTGPYRDAFTVFAGYYLALRCASVCFDNHQLVTANLWLRLSRIYRDCEDANMARYAWEKALADYNYAYEHFHIPEKQSQQLCYLIGDLYHKLGDLDSARNFFFLVKTNKAGTIVLKRQADQRLDEIREILRKQRENA